MTFRDTPGQQARQHIFQVSELNGQIKRLLEEKFPFIWISGEISNFKTPSSGHCYFTLKDQSSQVSAVIFRVQAQALKFRPEDGMSIVGLGRVSVYEPRGSYQVIFEYMEPQGVGALQIAFEKLKQKLSDEGLFDERHKKEIPFLPHKISIVTSPTGAAIRDFINVAQRRFPNLALEVVPVAVQGVRSPGEIINAIALLNQIGTTDVIVLARGGGSIEDLCAFNDEALARALFASRIPIVSAIGHETDFTIADFVADLRAPTPSAAAEITVPLKSELQEQILFIKQKLYKNINYNLILLKKNIDSISLRIVHPKRRLQDLRLGIDDFTARISLLIREALARNKERVDYRYRALIQASPAKTVHYEKARIMTLYQALNGQMDRILKKAHDDLARHTDMLEALNPLAILKRGYSITRSVPQRTIVRNARQVKIGQSLEIVLGRGQLTVSVEDKQSDAYK
ncbi:XseA: exodeoxyribonuclease VII, large subunit [Desulfosarcina variabilis str. Montpellier]|uniref:exodeoxyribonuclease VII large subunit n=1 Tax=Desulfosarcina variabilis TaxID=2300 RepID=UPI003AFA6DBF